MQNYITVWISSQVRRVSSVVLVMLAFSAFGGESAQQSVVEIAAVDVGYRFHSFPIKKIGPQTLRPKTLFRVGRTLRLDMNLLTGSAHIVPNRGGEDKGADFRNFNSLWSGRGRAIGVWLPFHRI